MNAIPLSEQQMLAAMSSASSSGFEFLVPLLAAALDGKIQLTILPRGAPWPAQALRQRQLPSLVIIADDDNSPSGPDGWPLQIRRYARRAMIHAAGGSVESYKLALTRCISSYRYVLVETSSVHLESWIEFFQERPSPVRLDVIKPVDGQHPIARHKLQ